MIDTIPGFLEKTSHVKDFFLCIGAVYAVIIVAVTVLIKKIQGEGIKQCAKEE